jgi:hypothetical protein
VPTKGQPKPIAENDEEIEVEKSCATTAAPEHDELIRAAEANAAIDEMVALEMLRVRDVGREGLSSDTRRRLRDEAEKLKATPRLGGYPLARVLWCALMQISHALPDARSSKVISTIRFEEK